jgi:hypothetical protein
MPGSLGHFAPPGTLRLIAGLTITVSPILKLREGIRHPPVESSFGNYSAGQVVDSHARAEVGRLDPVDAGPPKLASRPLPSPRRVFPLAPDHLPDVPSNRACRFPASDSPTGFIACHLAVTERRTPSSPAAPVLLRCPIRYQGLSLTVGFSDEGTGGRAALCCADVATSKWLSAIEAGIRFGRAIKQSPNSRLLVSHDETHRECAVTVLFSCQTSCRTGNDIRE